MLIHLSQASLERDIGKQCGPKIVKNAASDQDLHFFALRTELSIKHGNNKN